MLSSCPDCPKPKVDNRNTPVNLSPLADQIGREAYQKMMRIRRERGQVKRYAMWEALGTLTGRAENSTERGAGRAGKSCWKR
ncbi:hypothetical protein AGMMS49593_07910 [Endomicrobiia bacterium]|nr:hypothetical protein AGMMS49593_07910 [Endomicrobiia bacterium]